MRYLADILTGIRLVLALVVPACILTGHWGTALVLFGVAALSDALDGPCARRWPYTPEQAARLPWRKLDHHAIDNIPDGLMVALATAALVFTISYWWVMALLIYGVSAVFIVTVQWLIRQGKVRAAELTDVVFGYWFVINVGMVVVEIAYRAGALVPVLICAAVIAAPLFYMKRDRATSRPETRLAAARNMKQS